MSEAIILGVIGFCFFTMMCLCTTWLVKNIVVQWIQGSAPEAILDGETVAGKKAKQEQEQGHGHPAHTEFNSEAISIGLDTTAYAARKGNNEAVESNDLFENPTVVQNHPPPQSDNFTDILGTDTEIPDVDV